MYDWTSMPNVSPDRAFEAHYRAAITAATVELEKIVTAGTELPLFSWGTFSSPKNEPAKVMTKAIEAALAGADSSTTLPAGSRRVGIVTLAVRAAYMVRSFGFGTAGWESLAKVLRQPKAGSARPAPAVRGS